MCLFHNAVYCILLALYYVTILQSAVKVLVITLLLIYFQQNVQMTHIRHLNNPDRFELRAWTH